MSEHKIFLKLRTPAHWSAITFTEAVALANVDYDFMYDKHLSDIYSALHAAQGCTNEKINMEDYVSLVASSTHYIPTINGYILSLQQLMYETVLPYVLGTHASIANLSEIVSKISPVEPYFTQKATLETIKEKVSELQVAHINAFHQALKARIKAETELANAKNEDKAEKENILASANDDVAYLKKMLGVIGRIEHVSRYLLTIPRSPNTNSAELFASLLTVLRWSLIFYPELFPTVLGYVNKMTQKTEL